jgi:hypothetical protein
LSSSEEQDHIRAVLTRQFSLEDIKYEVYSLFCDAGLPLPRIIICDSFAAKEAAVKAYFGGLLQDDAWKHGQDIIMSRFHYIRDKRLGSEEDSDRRGWKTIEELSNLRVELGIWANSEWEPSEQGFGLAFENRYGTGGNRWNSFLSKGIFSVSFFETVCFVCRCPTKILRDERRRLHSMTEGAVQWANGDANYYIQGVLFPKILGTKVTTRALDPKEVIRIENAEQRAEAIRLYGYDALLERLSPVVLDDKVRNGIGYELFRVNLNDDGGLPAHLLKVECPSTGKKYFLRVSPSIRKVANALAWTFPGVGVSEYEQLIVES